MSATSRSLDNMARLNDGANAPAAPSNTPANRVPLGTSKYTNPYHTPGNLVDTSSGKTVQDKKRASRRTPLLGVVSYPDLPKNDGNFTQKDFEQDYTDDLEGTFAAIGVIMDKADQYKAQIKDWEEQYKLESKAKLDTQNAQTHVQSQVWNLEDEKQSLAVGLQKSENEVSELKRELQLMSTKLNRSSASLLSNQNRLREIVKPASNRSVQQIHINRTNLISSQSYKVSRMKCDSPAWLHLNQSQKRKPQLCEGSEVEVT